jgi:Transglutaminase-like superfamily
MRPLSVVSKLRRLSGAERRLLLVSAILLPLLAAALRAVGFARVRRWLVPTTVQKRARSDVEPQTLALLVNAASNHLPIAGSCLTRSLVLDWMLRRRGVDSALRFGVRLVDGRLQAHAWVELGGRPLNEVPGVAGSFAPFESRRSARLPVAP